MNTDPIHYLTQDELTRLFGMVEFKRDRAIFRIAYTYDLRASEFALLERADVALSYSCNQCEASRGTGWSNARLLSHPEKGRSENLSP